MPYLMIWQRNTQVSVAGNRNYKETDSINSVQSSLKSHPLWVTLYIFREYRGTHKLWDEKTKLVN